MTSRWWLVCFYLYEGPYAQRGDASILPYAVMDPASITRGRAELGMGARMGGGGRRDG